MARTHYIRKSRKDQHCRKGGHTVPKGQPYHYAEFRYRGKATGCPKHPLRPSDHTGGKMSAVMAGQEAIQDATGYDAQLDAAREIIQILQDVGSEYQDSVDNMPEGLQQGYKGEAMQQLADDLDNFASEIESDIDGIPEMEDEYEDDDERSEAQEERDNAIQEVLDRIDQEVPEPEW